MMGLGVWFSEDLAHVLHGVGEGVNLLVAQRGVVDAADAAYIAGYFSALRAVAVALGLPAAAVTTDRLTLWEGQTIITQEGEVTEWTARPEQRCK